MANTKMIKMGSNDNAFLQVEKPETPMQVGGFTLLKYPKDADRPKFIETLKKDFSHAIIQTPPFNQKIIFPKFNVGLPSLIKDDNLDLSYHVRHFALPEPGTKQQLFDFISHTHGILLDRSRPMWELNFIENIEKDYFGIHLKIHHSVMDGIGAMNLLKRFFSESPKENSLKLKKKKKKNRKKENTSLFDKPFQLLSNAQKNLNIAKELGTTSLEIAQQLLSKERVVPPWYTAPPSPLNQLLDSQRSFAVSTYSMKEFKTIGKAFNATLNDVLLTACSGALRRYLADENFTPSRSLIANIPVAIAPTGGEEQSGNAISAIQCNLGTDIADPIQRLKHIRNSTKEGKAQLNRMSTDTLLIYNMMMAGPFIASQLLNITQHLPLVFNILISNVPASNKKLFLCGAEMLGLYAVNLIFETQALNITVTTYLDNMDFNFIACSKILPNLPTFTQYVRDSYDELKAAAGV